MRRLVVSVTTLVMMLSPAYAHLPSDAKCLPKRRACRNASRWIHHFWRNDANAHDAISVASCESGLDRRAVSSGGHKGLFQFGEFARENYGYGWRSKAQARAAHAYWEDAGWSPWTCQP